MKPRVWLGAVFAVIALAAGLAWAAAWSLDPYGLWRGTRGRSLPNYFGGDRRLKVLLNRHYVPENFQGLILGPSSAANWDVRSLGGAAIYNDSLDGGNALELKYVMDQALREGHYRIAAIFLAPMLTHTHVLQDQIDDISPSEGLASVTVFANEAERVLAGAGHPHAPFLTASGQNMNFPPTRAMDLGRLPEKDFFLDPVSIAALQSIVQRLQAQNACVLYVIPPMYAEQLQLNADQYEAYRTALLPKLPSAPVLDFNSPRFATLRGDRSLFLDADHLQPKGAAVFAQLLSDFASQRLREGCRESNSAS